MKQLHKIIEVKKSVSQLKNENKTIGFVPTMGALHQGHLSLIKESIKHCDITLVSIFVNPTQFNDKTDLEKYPRTLDADLQLLKEINTDIVFTPDVDEMYPEEDNRKFDFGFLETVMEGANRPGHFNGVAQIVSKLFDIVMPTCAFFGKKDFQQVAIIKSLVKKYNYPIRIVACPIMRENSGLAMSSRNERLSDKDRIEAAIINKVLKNSVEKSKTNTVSEVKKYVENEFLKNTKLDLEYYEIVDDLTLESIKTWNDSEHITACIVAHIGGVRLIDNMQF